MRSEISLKHIRRQTRHLIWMTATLLLVTFAVFALVVLELRGPLRGL